MGLKRYLEKIKYSTSSFFSRNPTYSQRAAVVRYLVVALLAGAFFYFIGGYFTGLPLTAKIVYVSTQLSSSQNQVENLSQQLAAAQNQSTALQSQLNSTQSSLQSCQNSQQTLQTNYNILQNSSSALQDQLNACNANVTSYQTVVTNSVRAVCCSYSDIQAGTTKNWTISSNTIVCNGTSTVNCGTGSVTQ